MSGKARVLYIEDDNASRLLVQRVLTNSGYEVFMASDGIEGVTLAQQALPNLILMDINLPHLDGRALTTRLRNTPEFSDTPIVALTANAGTDNRKLALAAGCTGYLTKPINVDEFPDQIASFLDGQRHKLSTKDHQHHLERYTQEMVAQLEQHIRELEEANHRMEELTQLKGDFLTLASHELRSPLSVINTYIGLLEMKIAHSDMPDHVDWQPIPDLVERMKVGMERMGQVVDEIINVSEITSGLLNLNITPVHLGRIVASVVIEAAPICQERQLALHVEAIDTLPLIQADGDRLKTAVSNVIGNAIKYTPDGGHIYITGTQSPTEVQLTVRDTGVGIPAEMCDYIFEPFATLGSISHHSTSKSAFKGGGLGLGLSIAKGIIEAHRGHIWAQGCTGESDSLPGTALHIALPWT